MGLFERNNNPEWASKIEADFLAAYDAYADDIFRHALIRIRDRELARDITQDAFTRTWLYLSAGKEIKHVRAFLYQVANNLIVDSTRKHKAVSLDVLAEESNFEIPDDSISPPIDTPALREALALLDDMDENYRAIITMRYIDEFGPKEIAQILGLSENIVSVRLHRGMNQLREKMHKDAE